MKTIKQHAEVLKRAIEKSIAEHGAPNTFSFGELHAFAGAPPPMIAGRAAKLIEMPNVTFAEGRAIVSEARAKIVCEPFIRVVSMDEPSCREFALSMFGMKENEIVRVEDSGPAKGDRWKEGAREFHVFTTSRRTA